MENSRKTTKINFLEKMILTFFSVGCIPYAPGTFGTIASIPLAFYLKKYTSDISIIGIIVVLTICLSFYIDAFQKKHELDDPNWIVIDEVLGYLTASLFIAELDIVYFILVAIVFRFFDIFKPWPVNYFDQKVKHGSGIILDDIVAGLYSGVLFIILKYFNFLP